MKNGHNDMMEPIRAIPFVFSTSSFLANGLSTLRLFVLASARRLNSLLPPHAIKRIRRVDY